MTHVISDAVICGEINNSRRNSVTGWIRLRGIDRPLILQLTGNCGDDLAGRCFRFEAAGQLEADEEADTMAPLLAPRQVGPVGTMTARGQVQLVDCAIAPPDDDEDSDPLLDLHSKSCLVLDWFGQDGHVRIELLGADILYFDHADEALDADEASAMVDEEFEEELDEEEDPYGLFPADLHQHVADGLTFDRPSDENELGEWDDDVNMVGLNEQPLQSLFDPPIKLYPSESLTDHQIEATLQALLARLARYGVALDMCEHFTAREAYQLLLDHILPEESVALKLVENGYIQHFSTYEFCPSCLEEAEVEDTQCDSQADDDSESPEF
jgi:hypothetical protein